MTTHGKYVFIISFDSLYFTKNNIVKVTKRKSPSDLTIVANDTKTNDIIVDLLLYLKKITRDEITSKMNNGSVIPTMNSE